MTVGVLENRHLRLEYRADALRVSGLFPRGKPNLLAEISAEKPIPTPYGDFYFYGGHRLWHAPEAMPRSYVPDREVTREDIPSGVILQSAAEAGTGIRKRIEIRLRKNAVTLTHRLFNEGLWDVTLAAWTITQLQLGGVAILPMPLESADEAGLLPNRHLAFWSYAKMNDPRLTLRDGYSFFYADALPPFKMGYFNPHGWLAYWADGVLFRKRFEVFPTRAYPDGNCNAEIYGDERFVELESLSPLQTIAPGESVCHVETWEVFRSLDSLPKEAALFQWK